MAEQEEFDKWFCGLVDENLHKPIDCETLFLNKDDFEIGWQACAERKNAIIEKQAKELEALRGFALRIYDYGSTTYGHFEDFGLIDENGNPEECLSIALDKITKRKTTIVNGVAAKE